MITRTDYLSKKATHREYYAQFVCQSLVNAVACSFKPGALKAALEADENLNSYELQFWDSMAHRLNYYFSPKKMKEAGDWLSPAGAVCILKEAARQAVEKEAA